MNMENRSCLYENEHNKLMKIINFRFPHKFKKAGILAAVLIFGFLLVYKFSGYSNPLLSDLCRTTMLLLLLMSSLSKDVIEDEYVNHIRSQSYILAFVCATAYSIVLPLITLLLDVLITNINNEGNINFYEVSAFEVMFMLICFQLLFFETLKRIGRA